MLFILERCKSVLQEIIKILSHKKKYKKGAWKNEKVLRIIH